MDAQHEARALIRPVKEAVEDDLISRPGVVGVDIAEKLTDGKPTGQLSIVVFVEAKKPTSRVAKGELIPKEINGIPTDVQELVVELQQRMRKLDEVTELVDAAAYTALHGGIGIGPRRSVYLTPPEVPSAGNYVFVGTLGAMVKDRTSGATMALTNFHVACVKGWMVGDRMVQPSLVDNAAAAVEFGSIVRSTLSERVDGSVISLDAGKTSTATIEELGNVTGTATATVGLAVEKRGRTTGHTYGSVVSTDFTVSINYGDPVGTRTLRHQLRIQTDTTKSARFSDHGDSGSVIVDASRKVVGLLFAGSNDGTYTFANPIASVQDELGVDIIAFSLSPIITRPVICDVVTKPVICTVVSKTITCNTVSKVIICNQPSKTIICNLPTKPVVCDVVTTTVVCNLVTKTIECVAVTKSGCIPIPDPGDPGFGQSGTGEEFLAGYLAALEAVAAEEQADGRA